MGYQTKESRLASQLEAWLAKKAKEGAPLFWEHRSGGGGFSYKKGAPDFFAVANGTHIEIELKAPDGRLSAMQEKFKWRCEAIWKIPYCCPRTLEEAIEAIEPFLQRKGLGS